MQLRFKSKSDNRRRLLVLLQFEKNSGSVTMTDNIRAVLLPIFIISYVCGIRMIEFCAGELRPWISRLYILLFWSINYSFVGYTIGSYLCRRDIVYQIVFWLNFSTALLSVVLGMYYNEVGSTHRFVNNK